MLSFYTQSIRSSRRVLAGRYRSSRLLSIGPFSLKAITKDEMDTISDSSTQLLTSALRDLESPAPQAAAPPKGHGGRFESDVASFLWSEAPGDLLSDSAWVSVAQRDPQHHSGLAMKTLALTPCVQSFCTALDAKLRTRLDDLQHYLPVQEPGAWSGCCIVGRIRITVIQCLSQK